MEIKESYVAPATEVIVPDFEGDVCQSGGVGGRGGYDPDDDNPFEGQ